MLFAVEVFEFPIDRFFFLLDPAFRTLDLSSCVAYLLLQGHADAVGFLFRLEDHLLHLGLGIRKQLFPLRSGGEILLPALVAEPDIGEEGSHGRTQHDPD